MFGLGMPELIIIFVIAFFIFGGKKLPEIGSGLGKAITSFKKGLNEVEESGREIAGDIPGVKEAAEVSKTIKEVKDLGKVNKLFK
ncbi:MAG: twin-arginine translocase TatA/TatE family subunit [Deltaproteobacteria bacterium]|nr:MAG: twin-arginine translocase TatA/TatE family subunit [Deltaproteobacteria bacterium]PIE73231.1 MAG: twin-arginine translocase TatA/TatE family subunit [Deltaproteobacteria bacterium]